MKFDVTQRIQGSVDEVQRAMLHPDYPAFLLQHHGVLLEVEPLELNDSGDVVRRRVRYRPRPVINQIGPKHIPPEWFAFVEESTFDKRRKEMTFKNVPTSRSISNMLVNTGTIRLRDVGGQTERTVSGDINIKVPFLLKPLAVIAEKIIQSEGTKILDGDVPVLNRFIAEKLRASSVA